MSVHSARLIHFPEDNEAAEAFVAMCSCATVSAPFPTQDEAVRWATDHGATVEGIEVVTEEGGVGWGCFFCGSPIENAPLRISVHWTDNGVDDEQWFASHRECLLERMSKDEGFSPLFAR